MVVLVVVVMVVVIVRKLPWYSGPAVVLIVKKVVVLVAVVMVVVIVRKLPWYGGPEVVLKVVLLVEKRGGRCKDQQNYFVDVAIEY